MMIIILSLPSIWSFSSRMLVIVNVALAHLLLSPSLRTYRDLFNLVHLLNLVKHGLALARV